MSTVIAIRVPLCFSAVSLSLAPARGSWRKRPCARVDSNVPACSIPRKVRFFKKHGHIGPQPMSILLTADAGLYKPAAAAQKGDTPPLWAEGAKPCKTYLRRKAATISMNCAFVGGCDNGWPAMRASKLWSGCLQHACTRVRRFLSTQLVVV